MTVRRSALSAGRGLLGSALGLLLGCPPTTSPIPAEPASLVDHGAWEAVRKGSDLFGDRPEEAECSTLSWGTEQLGQEETLFVDTQSCAYLDVAQPSLAPIAVGDEVRIRVWHYTLTAFEEAEAHVATSVGGDVLWEARVPIPSDSGLLSAAVPSPIRAPEGSEVVFHLHNHGANSWNLVELSVTAVD